MVKKILIWSISVILFFGLINPYAWYCSELTTMGNLYQIMFSECFLIKLISVFLAMVLLDYANIKKYWIITVALAIVIMKVLVITFNIGSFEMPILIQNFLGYIGNFVGIILGALYMFWEKREYG